MKLFVISLNNGLNMDIRKVWIFKISETVLPPTMTRILPTLLVAVISHQPAGWLSWVNNNWAWAEQPSPKKPRKRALFFLAKNHSIFGQNSLALFRSPPHMEQSIAAADLSLVKINKNQNGFSNLLSQHTYALRNYWFLRGYVF